MTGKPGRHLRARGPLQTAIDLVLQQFGSLIEQIHGYQTVGEPPDHLVAAAADRRQLAKIVEQRERVDGRQAVAFAGEEQRLESRRRLILDAPGHVRIRMRRHGAAHDIK